MNYLSDNIACKLNGEAVRLAILIEDGHIFFCGVAGEVAQLVISPPELLAWRVQPSESRDSRLPSLRWYWDQR